LSIEKALNEAAGAVTGNWSENNYGLSGHITGSANTRNIEAQVTVSAQNISVRVSVSTSGSQQTVTLRVTTPEGLTEISVHMRRA